MKQTPTSTYTTEKHKQHATTQMQNQQHNKSKPYEAKQHNTHTNKHSKRIQQSKTKQNNKTHANSTTQTKATKHTHKTS